MTSQVMTIDEIKASRAVRSQNVQVGLTSLDSFELAQRAAKLLASSNLVPQDYQNNLPNCVIALNMATRIGADVLMVMQNLVPIHGKPSWSSQFLIATFNSCGRYTSLRYEFFGEKGTDSYGCRAYTTELSTGERIVGSDITIGLAKDEGWYQKKGSKWQSMPQQMLMYRAASWLVRAYAPELTMGLHTAEEEQDRIIDVTPVNSADQSEPAKPAPAGVNQSKRKRKAADPVVVDHQPDPVADEAPPADEPVQNDQPADEPAPEAPADEPADQPEPAKPAAKLAVVADEQPATAQTTSEQNAAILIKQARSAPSPIALNAVTRYGIYGQLQPADKAKVDEAIAARQAELAIPVDPFNQPQVPQGQLSLIERIKRAPDLDELSYFAGDIEQADPAIQPQLQAAYDAREQELSAH